MKTNTETNKITKDEDKENKLEFSNSSKHRGYIKFYDVLACYQNLSLTDRIVYCTCRAYAQLSPCKNITYISSNTIANRLNISRATVTRSLSILQKLGIISTYKNEKSQRVIKIERDFEEEQEEEKQYWATHEKELKKFNESIDTDDSEEEKSYEAYAFDFD